MASDYDKIIKENIESVFLPVMDKLLNIQADSFEDIPYDVQVTIERKPDFIKRVINQNQSPYILHLEFQSTDETDMVYRMLEYRALLTRKHMTPVVQFVVYIGDSAPKMNTRIKQENLDYRFVLKNLRDYDHRTLLASDIPEEIILAILGDFNHQPPVEVLRTILQRLTQLTADDIKLQRYVRQLGVLSRLRNLQYETYKQIKQMPVEFDIETDYVFLRGKEAGIKQGVVEGLKEGREEGEKAEKRRLIVSMLRSGQLTDQQIATFADVPIAYVEKVRAAMGLQ